jgi:tetratricopeptide (TPR) repeat protein
MPKLSKESSEKISELSKEAETLVAQRRLKEAVKKYDRALKLVPEPVERYEATTWLLVAKGDALLAAGDVSGGADAFAYARYCFKGDNPYVLLKEGICLFELGEPSRALQSLARAYMSG